jgi:hypothetical protein
MSTQNHSSGIMSRVLNPFPFVRWQHALGAGLVAMVFSGLFNSVSRLHVAVLDLNYSIDAPWWFFVCEGIIAWICVSVVLLSVGMTMTRARTDVVRLFSMQALARAPALITSIALFPGVCRRFHDLLKSWFNGGTVGDVVFTSGDVTVLVISAVGATIGVCWMLFLMYNAYSTSFGIRGARVIHAFVTSVVIAEMLSLIMTIAFGFVLFA